ncbi:hypothetical protein PUN28_012222 [Cardiocondyla obscurior]|uniref:SEFIR domain-containing protein n=1 Tax=Cardiocondyla obscurior TaxID=286306 RepID=A0AAW2FD04_9HYME
MQKTIEFLGFLVLGFFAGCNSASDCYPNYCLAENRSDLIPKPGFACVLTTVQRGEGCQKLKFVEHGRSSKRSNTAVFTLHAYVKVVDLFNNTKATAFNLSISDISFHKLVTRYQNIVDEDQNACRYIELYDTGNRTAPKDLYVSCPFSGPRYEGSPYRLEYLATESNYVYSRKYVFHVPQHQFIQDGIKIASFTPFIYIDVSDASSPALYVQPLPPSYNVTSYKVWLINNDTELIATTEIFADKDGRNIRHNFSAVDGVYYIKVAALHPECGDHGCANSTSPYVYIKHASHRLLIMIISLIWIPPVAVYALYHVFKLYRKRILKRMAKRPNCLLVYSPTHPSHVNVMAELAKYLRYCSINAMIDMFDITETTSKDPGLWCNTAFQTADVVLVVTSPPMSAKSDATIIYRNVDNHLLRLLKENYPRRNKRYFAVHLPYCKSDHLPEEARLFKKFYIPKDLTKLVKTIHGIVFLGFFPSSNHELLENIECATIKIFEDETASVTKNIDETDDLLPPIIVQETRKCDSERPIKGRSVTPDNDVIPQSFATRIDELNLLGEIDEEKSFVSNSTRNDCEFRIDKLNL